MRCAWLLAALLSLSCGDTFNEEGGGGEGPAACEADATLPCHEDPWVCANNDQTCSLNGDGTGYMCFNAGPKAEGEACTLYFGVPECQANLFCFQTQGAMMGTCRQWCSPTDPCKVCPGGQVCVDVTDNGAGVTLHLCQPPP